MPENTAAFFIHRNYETGEVVEVEMIDVLQGTLDFNRQVNDAFQEHYQDVLCDLPDTTEMVEVRVIDTEPNMSPSSTLGFEVVDYDYDVCRERSALASRR